MNTAVSALIPTFNGRTLLQKHLPQVFACLHEGDELIIVDDASTDDTVAWLQHSFGLEKRVVTPSIDGLSRSYWPRIADFEYAIYFGTQAGVRVVVVVLPENSRFAAAVNTGAALASNNMLFVLNNDVSPDPGARDMLARHFADSRVFAVGCLEYQGGGEGGVGAGVGSLSAHKNASDEPAGKNKLWFEQGIFRHSKAELNAAGSFDFGETAWASGGSGMFDRNKWLELDGFDPDYYPAYWEDIDLSHRARQRGWQVLFDPEAVVVHHHETTNSGVFGDTGIAQMSWKHADAFTWKHGSWLQRVQYLLYRPVWWWRRG